MTVKELIEILKKYPQNALVFTANEHGSFDLEESNIYFGNNQEDVKDYGEEYYEFITIS